MKYWLDISKAQQAKRLDARREDPLKQLKVSALDAEAQRRWKDYSKARDQMLLSSHAKHAPWHCVRNDHKKPGRLALISHLLHQIAPDHIADETPTPDASILFTFEPDALKDGRLAK